MLLKDFIFGRPLATSQERAEQIEPAAGIPIFGLDALSSAGYGPEAALTILLPLGLLGAGYIVPISTSIVALLAIVYFSYLQTIKAYPAGGGSYRQPMKIWANPPACLHFDQIATVSARWRAQNLFESLYLHVGIHESPCCGDTSNQTVAKNARKALGRIHNATAWSKQ